MPYFYCFDLLQKYDFVVRNTRIACYLFIIYVFLQNVMYMWVVIIEQHIHYYV